MSAELAGLLPTQKPGKVSKIPTLSAPPYVGCSVTTEVVVVDDEESVHDAAINEIRIAAAILVDLVFTYLVILEHLFSCASVLPKVCKSMHNLGRNGHSYR